MKITGATHDSPPVPDSLPSSEIVPEQYSSSSLIEMPCMDDILPTSVSPVLHSDNSEKCLQDELDFDEFLLDAAEWL